MTPTSLAPLNAAERARGEAIAIQVKTAMPELASEIKALRAAGFDIGWRDVTYIGKHRHVPSGAIPASRMVLESTERFKERMKNGTR